MAANDISDVRDFFDDYVRRDFPSRRDAQGNPFAWPGDEWVSDAVRQNTWKLLLDHGSPDRVVEIGPGAGKYTQMILERTDAMVRAFEISAAFLDVMRVRCANFVADDRLDGRIIDWTDNQGLVERCRDWHGKVDLLFGVDVFLMMDFQSTLAYLTSAALLLRRGGRLAGTFGDADSESGWRRMTADVARHSAFGLTPDTRFHWLSADFLRRTLDRLGFTTVVCLSGPDGPDGPLDIARLYVVAELTHPEKARELFNWTGE